MPENLEDKYYLNLLGLYYCSKIQAQMEWKQNCYYKQTTKKQIKNLLDVFKH